MGHLKLEFDALHSLETFLTIYEFIVVKFFLLSKEILFQADSRFETKLFIEILSERSWILWFAMQMSANKLGNDQNQCEHWKDGI